MIRNLYPDPKSIIPQIAEYVKKSQCVLFLGAGVHSPPPASSKYCYPEHERPPLGRALAEHLAGLCGFQEQFPEGDISNLQRVSLCFEIIHTRRQLTDAIKTAVQNGKKPSPVLRALAELPFTLIMTTNYDKLFEQALAQVGKLPDFGVYKKQDSSVTRNYQDPTPEQPFLFKIHGDIGESESIVITDEDYIQFLLRMGDKGDYNPIPLTFYYHLQTWPTLFVGYSLMDYNLRLLFKTLHLKKDPSIRALAYSVDPYPDDLIFNVWHHRDHLVTFVVQDVWEFVPLLYEEIMEKEMPQ